MSDDFNVFISLSPQKRMQQNLPAMTAWALGEPVEFLSREEGWLEDDDVVPWDFCSHPYRAKAKPVECWVPYYEHIKTFDSPHTTEVAAIAAIRSMNGRVIHMREVTE